MEFEEFVAELLRAGSSGLENYESRSAGWGWASWGWVGSRSSPRPLRLDEVWQTWTGWLRRDEAASRAISAGSAAPGHDRLFVEALRPERLVLGRPDCSVDRGLGVCCALAHGNPSVGLVADVQQADQ